VRFEVFAVPQAERYGPPVSLAQDRGAAAVDFLAPGWTQESIEQLIGGLDRAGRALKKRSVGDIAGVLGVVGSRFGTEGDPVRSRALDLLPPTAGYSPEMASAVLDGMAADWTEERLLQLVTAEFEDPGVLDGFTEVRGRTAMAVGPHLCTQVVAGSVPGVTVTALIRSLLVKGPTLVKPGLGDVVLPVLFARALAEEDPLLADALAVVYWPGGSVPWEAGAFAGSDMVVAYGSDETITRVRAITAPTSRFIGYRHRVALAVIAREALAPERVDSVASELASAVAMFDQRGCVCPQLVFVEEAGATSPADFAEKLADAFDAIEERLPSGELTDDESARLHQFRGNAELRAASGQGQLHHGGEDAPWTVAFEPEAVPGLACLGRTVRVRPLRDASALDEMLAPLGPHLQTIGAEGFGERLPGLARAWGHLGASRIVPVAEMSFPPPWWYHDGRAPLQDLVRWVEADEG
jgi:hypothetical protein